MTMKPVNRYSQDDLKENAICMLDFDSEIFIWIGSAVPKDKIVTCFKHVGNACMGVHGKGKRRIESIAFSVVYQGYEPQVFT